LLLAREHSEGRELESSVEQVCLKRFVFMAVEQRNALAESIADSRPVAAKKGTPMALIFVSL